MSKIVTFLLLFFSFSFLFVTDNSFDQDLGRHLKLGEIIVNTGQIPKTNLFSYTNPDFPFINTHWLFEVLVYLGSTGIGLQAILVLKIVIILLSVWLTLKTIPQEKQLLLLPLAYVFLHVLRERVELRPEILSFLFTALSLYILEKFKESLRARTIFFLPLIQLIWVNTHIYFFVGLLLQVIFLSHLTLQHLRGHLESRKLKLLIIVFIISVLASLINPAGLDGFLYPLVVNQNYGYSIVENQNLFFLEGLNFRNPNFIFAKIAGGIVIFSLFISALKRQINIKNWLLALTGLGLALLHVRSLPYLVFLSLPATLENFGKFKVLNWQKIMLLIFSILILFESFLYLSGEYYQIIGSNKKPILKFEEHGKNALDFALVENLPQPIFNNFDIGSYIIYRGYPKFRVFVDGRPEAYPANFFQGIYIPSQADYQNFKIVDQQINFQTVIFSHTDQTPWAKNFLQSIVKDPTWKVVFLDDFMVIFTKSANMNTAPL